MFRKDGTVPIGLTRFSVFLAERKGENAIWIAMTVDGYWSTDNANVAIPN